MIFERHANLKCEYGNWHFWATRKYIQEQEKQEQIEDKVSTREYENSFKGKARQSVHNGLNEVTASVLETLAVPWPLQGFFKPSLSGAVLTFFDFCRLTTCLESVQALPVVDQ